MKITMMLPVTGGDHVLDVASAVVVNVNDTLANGSLERLEQGHDRLAGFVGALTRILVDRGVLSASDIRELLGSSFRVEP